MSKLLLILALGFGVLAPSATAQQHKVLVYSSQEDTRGEQLKNLLELLVDGEVEHRTNLPGLSEFEAVFYLNQLFQPVALSDQAALAEFAHSGGALFLRGGFREGPIGEATNPLWHAVKDSGIMMASQSIATLGTYGLNGTFAAGFMMGNPTYDMMIQDVGGLARSKGLRPVLIQSGEQGYTESAWISPDPSIKFVLENLWGSYAQDAFVTRVACNYFNLCTMSAYNRSKSTPTITFDPVLSQLRLPGAGSIEICDLLGRVILSTEVGGSYTIPEAIARGSYLVRWYSSDSQASTTILTF